MCIAYRILRLNSRHAFKVHGFSTHLTESVGEGLFYCLELKIQAKGLPLQNPRVCISFMDGGKWGNCESFMTRYDPIRRKKVEGNFIVERGEVATFAIKYGIDKKSIHRPVSESFFYDIKNSELKKCSIRIYHEDVVVAERKTRVFENLMSKWNRFAYTFEYKTTKIIKREGDVPVIKYRWGIPKFEGLVSSPIKSFAKVIHEHEKHQVSSDNA